MSDPLSESGARHDLESPDHPRTNSIRRWAQGDHEFVLTPTFTIGRHNLPTRHDEWRHERRFGTDPLVAFCSTPIKATFEGNWPAMLDRSTVATPPIGAGYTRTPVTEEGHVVSWITVPRDLMCEIVSLRDDSASDRPDRPFLHATTPADVLASSGMSWLSNALFESDLPVDPMQLDEAALAILDRIARRSAESQGKRSTQRDATRRRHREITNETCQLIATRFGESLSIADLSGLLGVSPAYLSRIFRRNTGQPIHQYLICTRLLNALEMMQAHTGSLAWVAARCGFANHAHLTSTCTSMLGCPPRELDLRDARRNLRLLLTRSAS